MRKIILFLFVILFLLVSICNAQTENSNQSLSFEKCTGSDASDRCKEALGKMEGITARKVRADFFVPDSPAFSVLGVTPEKVIRPESTRDFAMALLNGVDPKGNMQSGIAIDTAPYVLKGVNLANYNRDYFERFLTRAQLSFATTKGGSDDDKSAKASVGLRLTLFDYGDPRMDKELYDFFDKLSGEPELDGKIKDKKGSIEGWEWMIGDEKSKDNDHTKIKIMEELLQKEKEELKKFQAEKSALKEEPDKNKKWTAFLKEKEKGRWNATSAAIGFAPVFLSEDGEFNDLESEGFTAYATLSYGFEGLKKDNLCEGSASNWFSKNAHFLLHARYEDDVKEALSDGSGFRGQDTLTLGAQLRFQGPTIWAMEKGGDFAFGFEADYIKKDYDKGGDDEVWRYTGVAELKPFKDSGMTLKLTVGGESGNEDDDSSFVVSTINWAMD